MKIKRKRRFLTLLEVMIAMGLAMGVLSALAAFHWQMVSIGLKAEQEYADLSRQFFIRHRISEYLSEVKPPNNEFFFFSSEDPIYPGLVFCSDRGVDLNRHFANQVICRIFVYNKTLFLAVLPAKKKWDEQQPPIMVDELAEDVADFKVAFVDSEGNKTFQWEKNRKGLPAIVEFSMTIKGRSCQQKMVIPLHEKVLTL